MVRQVLEWVDEKMETECYDRIDKDKDAVIYTKAFCLGAVEGLLDGLVVSGVMLCLTASICNIAGKLQKKK